MITTAEREALILAYYPMVYRVARRMAARYPSSVDLDDLVSIGTMGLIDAADRFDEGLCNSFAGYARIRVQGAIVDALRKADWVPRSVRNRHRNINQSKSRLEERLGRMPTAQELADDLELPLDGLDHYTRDASILTLVSMEESRADSDQRIADSLESDTTVPEVAVLEQSERGIVAEALSQLPERDQMIVRMYYYEDRSFKEIGVELGVTESRVSQLHSRIKRRLRDALEGDAVQDEAAA
jgi:RNA polymerase sigma factor for flagellar operon FliA